MQWPCLVRGRPPLDDSDLPDPAIRDDWMCEDCGRAIRRCTGHMAQGVTMTSANVIDFWALHR